MIKRLFSPPPFDNAEDNFRAKFINGFAWFVVALLSVAIITYLLTPMNVNTVTTIAILSALILVMLLSLYVLRTGNLNLSGAILLVLGWLGLGVQAYTADGVRDVIIVAYIAISLLASIIISWRAGSIFMILSIAAIWALGLLEANGSLKPRYQEPITFSRDLTFVFMVIGVLIYFSTVSLQEAIARANKSEEGLVASNKNLQTLNQTLEERVNQRTAEIEEVTRYHAQRARQFEAISQVIRVIAAIQDMDTLLPYVTQLISEQFNAYHTGIFLLDGQREYAVLRAANSDGGRRMLARGHKLRVGQTGIVGMVTATGQSRIALDVGADAAYFNNPDLPDTHSEIALPLRYAGQIIGALDVQSTGANAFVPEDIEVLLTLADQVSATIQNAITIEDFRREAAEHQKSIGESARESWKVMRPKSLGLGFEYIESKIRPLEKPLEGGHIQDAIAQNKPILANLENAGSVFAIPIRLRGKIVGIINLRANNNYKLTDDDMEIVAAVTDRLSLAIETVGLLQAARHRADIERITTDISSKISSSSQFETILKTAAQELSRALGGSDVLVQIEPISMELSMTS
jgi:GAF domain-containing protein